MALLTAGYWQTTFWCNSYWHEGYWQDYGTQAPVGEIISFYSEINPVLDRISLLEVVTIG
jgi:hypothetical protein